MMRVLLLTIFMLCYFNCDVGSAEIIENTCLEKSRPHSTECNKYFKCIKLPNNSLKWITLTCQEGLIYDSNLRSCAIPDENWDCVLNSAEMDDYNKDENNIYGIENLRLLQKESEDSEEDERDGYRSAEGDDFLEVIDGDEILNSSGESRSENDENSADESSNYSGDGSVLDHADYITQSTPPSMQMITTQVQRLTQLIQNNPKNNADDLSADELNSYLNVHKIQTKSPDYQNSNFQSNDKTPIPQNGKIHSDIMNEILSKQNKLNSIGLKETTLAMDEITEKPVIYFNKEPITEIQLKGGQGIDGLGAHQIVVNRPEGAVLFNVPSSDKNNVKEHTPYISEDILKTILELSKQMVTQNGNNNQKNANNNQENTRPIYYAIPFPIYSPQPHNNFQNNYDHFMNNSLRPLEVITTTTTMPLPAPVMNMNIIRRKPVKKKLKNKVDFMGQQNLRKPQDNFNQLQLQQHQQPLDYYSYYNNYQQNYPSYGPLNYYQQYQSENDRYTNNLNQNLYNNRLGNFYGNSFYENRPIVSDSSASIANPYTNQLYSTPYRKESLSPYNNNDEYDALHEESDESENNVGLSGSFSDHFFYEDEPSPPKDPTFGLICSFGTTRQANLTDCTKYYVCNSKTKEVTSYSCPFSTAFNDQTKYCDKNSFTKCKEIKDREQGKLNNKKYYQQAHKALQQAKLESEKIERLANMVRKESQKILQNRAPSSAQQNDDAYQDEQDEEEMLPQQEIYAPPPIRQRSTLPPVRILSRPSKRPQIKRKVSKISNTSKSSSNKRRKKKKVKCSAIGNIADPEDMTSYWHCFKSPDNRMKRIHKKCSSNLIFCDTTRYCSSSLLFVLIFITLCIILKVSAQPFPIIKRHKQEEYFFDPVSNEKHLFSSIDDEPTLELSVIIPAYDEEKRLPVMLEECLDYLEQKCKENSKFSYEIIVVSDGSKDKTVEVALQYSKKLSCEKFRVLELIENRGKGGAVRLGMLSSRGKYLLFADADGATKFSDYTLLEKSIAKLSNGWKQEAISIGSRAHLEKESTAKRSIFRTFLMHGFHMLVWFFAVKEIKDTQCGFKVLTRSAARIVFSNMHVEKWAFDVELLYIAQSLKMPIEEIAVNWTEIEGSKITPFFSWIQMGRDLVLIWLRYQIGAWKLKAKSN
ncbi:hypothetical protein PVAND_005200 [Polypedilum vanderplanki]|uniref:Dolichyl-phosphate beta-glucosyltransferase n=1 Tax=Polypedilum vanderplanki TaxID=319348 RepID=A0A9J6C048_POLVA|nr:hypothetical protein PVAND_005200 [Polypedilum vanderplanki]